LRQKNIINIVSIDGNYIKQIAGGWWNVENLWPYLCLCVRAWLAVYLHTEKNNIQFNNTKVPKITIIGRQFDFVDTYTQILNNRNIIKFRLKSFNFSFYFSPIYIRIRRIYSYSIFNKTNNINQNSMYIYKYIKECDAKRQPIKKVYTISFWGGRMIIHITKQEARCTDNYIARELKLRHYICLINFLPLLTLIIQILKQSLIYRTQSVMKNLQSSADQATVCSNLAIFDTKFIFFL
jgi:hypothetical protein